MGILDFLKENREKENYGLALDVGTEWVKALVFKRNKNDEAEVLGVGKKRQRLGDMQGGAVTDISGVIKNCQIAILKAEEAAGVSAGQAVMGIAGELVKGRTTVVHYKRKHPEKEISEKELKRIIEKIQEKSFEKARAEIASETGVAEIEVRLVNSVIVEIKIDGFKVQNPIGFQGRDVSVSIFNAFAPSVHFGALTTIAEDLNLDLLSIAVEPYAVARSIGLENDASFSAIFIDVGGGTTDIALVQSGVIEGTKMFAIGGRSFSKRIASDFSLSFIEAEKIKIDYSRGLLSREKKERVQQLIQNDLKTWLSGVELTLSEFEKVEFLPSNIFLCGGGSNLPEIKESLEKEDFYQKLPFAKLPRVKFIKTKDVVSVTDRTGKLASPIDITAMALVGISLDLMGREGVGPGLWEKIIKAVKI